MITMDFVMLAEIYNNVFSITFFVLAFIVFYIAFKGYKSKNNYGGSSTIICGIMYVIFGLYNVFYGFLLYPFTGFMIWWIGMILFVYVLFVLIVNRIKMKIKNNQIAVEKSNNSKLLKYVLSMTQENPYKDCVSFKMEIARKSFHLAGFLFILSYFGFFFLFPLTRIVNDTIIVFIRDAQGSYNILWGSIYDYPYEKGDFQAVIDLTMFALIALLFLALFSDIIRILLGPEYSIYNFFAKSILRKKEYNAFAAHIYLLSSVVLCYFLYIIGFANIFVVLSSILISCFSDALAALIGKKYGKHKIRCIGGDIKSIEGFIAGVGSAYIIGFIIMGPIYALIAALIFFVLDVFPTFIADNLSNPILLTIVLTLAILTFNLPIGWK